MNITMENNNLQGLLNIDFNLIINKAMKYDESIKKHIGYVVKYQKKKREDKDEEFLEYQRQAQKKYYEVNKEKIIARQIANYNKRKLLKQQQILDLLNSSSGSEED